jgi:Icc-related predicted phosphoesterase
MGEAPQELEPSSQEADPASGRAAPGRALPIGLLVAAFLLLAGYLAWFLGTRTSAQPILPPAGQVLSASYPVRFAVIGDNRGNMNVFERVLDSIKADGVSFIIHGGDLVRRCNELEYEWLLHELAEQRLGIPFCAVPGNHDILESSPSDEDAYRLYCRAFGPRRYWFACGDILFIAFDNAREICRGDDLQWLNDTVSRLRPGYRTCFVYMHVPPRDPRAGHQHSLDEADAKKLLAILRAGGVTAVFASHIHAYLADNIDGLPVYITGGGGAQLEDPLGTFHYLLCQVDASGQLTVRKVDIPGAADDDYPEYVARVKFPGQALLAAAIACLFAAALVLLRRQGRARQA